MVLTIVAFSVRMILDFWSNVDIAGKVFRKVNTS